MRVVQAHELIVGTLITFDSKIILSVNLIV